MKKIIILLMVMLATAALVPVNAQQVNVNININIDRQPAWGPVGYRYVDYYYFPDINVYYDVNRGLFYYSSRNRWIGAQYLPYKYRKYDLYSMYKVVVNERNPWDRNRYHRRDYARYKGNRTQVVIRSSNDSQYRKSRNNTVVWVEETKKNNRNTNNRSSSTVSSSRTNRNANSSSNSSSRSSNRNTNQSESRTNRTSR